MRSIRREIEEDLRRGLRPGKVSLLVGPRRVGKTVLLKKIQKIYGDKCLLLNGEDHQVVDMLCRRTATNYRQIFEGFDLIMIDEAQHIPGIGMALKFIVDELSNLKVIATGSSSFDMVIKTGQPLTGRSRLYHLFPLSERELKKVYGNPVEFTGGLNQRIIYGNYPEIWQLPNRRDKILYLQEMIHSYLLKDILAFENLRNSRKLHDLLRLIAYQVGSEVSLQELGRQLGISKNTVDRYLDLLEKTFVLHRLTGFSRNLKKEVTKSQKWYFIDNGIRNALLNNFQPIEGRSDVGLLWENYILTERLKQQKYQKIYTNNYFWRTYDQQEIDWVEEREGNLFAYEMKWKGNKHSKLPKAWADNYPDAHFHEINKINYGEWLML